MTRTLFAFLAAAPLLAQQVPAWKWDLPQITAAVNKVRAGRNLTPKPWPNNNRVAVALSFDVDAESLPLRSGTLSAQPMSRGEYSPRVGVPRILALLDKYNAPATFFIPAVDGHLHPETVDAILKARNKHEIGIHGWIHENITTLTADEERALTVKAVEFWTQRLGQKPAGIRTPSWDFTDATLGIIRELGFLYDSSLMGDDRPYEIVANGEPTGVVELPVEWIADDYAYYGFPANGVSLRMSDTEVFEIYRAEFDKAYEEGTMFLLTMHPFITGHRSRIIALDKLMGYMRSKPGAWFATHEQVARAAAEQLKK